jgi:anti-sigma B factor antagonist
MVTHSMREEAGVRVLGLEGPIDVSQAMDLRDVLGEAIDGPAARVVLDLTEVTFIDSSGIGVLVTAHRKADAAGAMFALAGARTTVGRVFELTRTNRLLRLYPSVDEAIEALRSP